MERGLELRSQRSRLHALHTGIETPSSGYCTRSAVGLFINSPGFGVARMIQPSERALAFDSRFQDPTPSQPGPRVPSSWSPGEFQQPPAGDLAFAAWLLEDSVKDFSFARGFGFIKDRRHVAGFQSHRFRQIPATSGRWRVQDDGTGETRTAPVPTHAWKVQTLHLVSLLLHDEPQVYVSDHLPRMDELHAAPTRPLDRFEAMAMNAVHRGEDLFISHDGESLRMVGASTA